MSATAAGHPEAPTPCDPSPEIDDEIAFHLEQRAGDFIAAGHPPDAAMAMAREAFGDVEAVRRACIRIQNGGITLIRHIHTVVTTVLAIAVIALAVGMYTQYHRARVQTEVALAAQHNLLAQLDEERRAERQAADATVYVSGPGIARPGVYHLPASGTLTVRRLLIAGGGVEQAEAGVVEVRRTNGDVIELRLDDVAQDVDLQPGDVVEVR